jgi:hypothetical protein
MAGKWFTECDYSVFISYTFDDNRRYNRWATCFGKELNLTLPTFLRGITVPDCHMSEINGAGSGVLDEQLQLAIADSFLMIVLVGENYAVSPWCLKELEYFQTLFGDDGLRQRFFIVVLSETAINKIKANPDWQHVTRGMDLISRSFYPSDRRTRPIPIYNDSEPGVATTKFWEEFVDLLEDLAEKISENIDMQRKQMGASVVARADEARAAAQDPSQDVADSSLVRILIESNQNEVDHWESVGAQTVRSWEAIVKDYPPPQLYVRPSGLRIAEIDRYERLDDADGVILLWGQKTADSLAAQITKVESKLSGPDFVPGVVAYLTPPQQESVEPIPAYGWPVVRFNAPLEQPIEVVAQDAHKLEAFLSKVLARKKRRADTARAQQRVAQP